MANTTQIKVPKGDDVLEVFLYPRFCYSLDSEQVTEEMLIEEINKYNQEIEVYTNDYVWHRDSLKFRPRTKQALLFDNLFESSGTIAG